MTLRTRIRAAIHVLRGRSLVAGCQMTSEACFHPDSSHVLVIGNHYHTKENA